VALEAYSKFFEEYSFTPLLSRLIHISLISSMIDYIVFREIYATHNDMSISRTMISKSELLFWKEKMRQFEGSLVCVSARVFA
jgi:hypothetical protein